MFLQEPVCYTDTKIAFWIKLIFNVSIHIRNSLKWAWYFHPAHTKPIANTQLPVFVLCSYTRNGYQRLDEEGSISQEVLKRILAKYFLYGLQINYLHWKFNASRSIFSYYATYGLERNWQPFVQNRTEEIKKMVHSHSGNTVLTKTIHLISLREGYQR